MKEKICFVTTVPGTLRAFVLGTAKYLHEKGDMDISFICDYDEKFADELPEYIHYYPVSMKRGISLGGIKAMITIQRIFMAQKFDMVQYSTPNASCYASIASWLARVPVRLYCQWGIAYVGFQGIKRSIFKMIEKTVCSLSTWVEPDSRGNLNFSHSEKLYPRSKGSVIWNGSASGVNLEKFDITQKEVWRKAIRKRYNIPEEATVFIFVGRITRDKGINELFSASKQLLNMNKNVYLLIVGAQENTTSLQEELYQWSQKEPRVIYCGYTKVVEQYLAASDVYVLPSYREGFGSAVIEAESMELPVIVSKIPGPTDAMKEGQTGLVVEKGNSDDLYNAMLRLCSDISFRTKLGKAAREFAVKNFEQKRLFEEILKDRERLLGIK